jgi:hypothetical protein
MEVSYVRNREHCLGQQEPPPGEAICCEYFKIVMTRSIRIEGLCSTGAQNAVLSYMFVIGFN